MYIYHAENPSLQPQIAMGLWEGLYDKPPVPPPPKFSNRHSGVPVSTTKMCFKENKWLVGC